MMIELKICQLIQDESELEDVAEGHVVSEDRNKLQYINQYCTQIISDQCVRPSPTVITDACIAFVRKFKACWPTSAG